MLRALADRMIVLGGDFCLTDCKTAADKELASAYEHEVIRRQNLNLFCYYLMENFLTMTQREAVKEHFSGMMGYSEKEAEAVYV